MRQIAKGKREAFDGARAVIVCDIWEVQTSCGYGVPRVKHALYAGPDPDSGSPATPVDDVLREGRGPGEKLDELAVFEARPTMDHWAANKAQTNTLHQYQGLNNAQSIDGLPGLRAARRDSGQRALWVVDAKARLKRICAEKEAVATGFLLAFFLCFALAGMRTLLLF